jgi:hypothetical protein
LLSLTRARRRERAEPWGTTVGMSVASNQQIFVAIRVEITTRVEQHFAMPTVGMYGEPT